MPVQALAVFLASSIAVTGALLADRGRYVYEFRAFDLNFHSNMLLSKASENASTSKAHKEIAKTWLRRSLDFRRQSIYITFSTVNMVFCAIFLFLAFLVDFFFDNVFFWLPLVIATGFLLASLSNYLIRYGFFTRSKFTCVSLFFLCIEDTSHKLTEKFPPLMPPLVLSHLSLSSWSEIGTLIENDKEIIEFIRRTGEYSDLKRHGLVEF